ncbi:MAG: hypothetical protein AB7F32_08945 [Victivallaceae bacterium]
MIATMLLGLIIFAGLLCVYTRSRPLAFASGVMTSVLLPVWVMFLNGQFSISGLVNDWKCPLLALWAGIMLAWCRAKIKRRRGAENTMKLK